MKRLNFVLPDWTRVIWSSARAKEVWEPRIQKISNAFLEIEKQLVFSGKKMSTLSFISKENYEYACKHIPSPYILHILEETYISNSYSNSTHGNILHHPKNGYRIVYTSPEHIEDWNDAWKRNDNEKVGLLLNYPKCCIKFFQKYWVEERFVDTTYPMSLNGTEGPKECNILLRWIGVRAVSHLPCSFSCDETYKIGRENIEFGRQLGYNEEMDWLEEMLLWPVQWSALHGIAEIKTPILKISTRTDATGDLVVVDKIGYSYPEEGAVGNKFPYVVKNKKPLTKSNSFRRSLLLDRLWKDNGFSSFESMSYCHQTLVDAMKSFFTEKEKTLAICDFGCGNGELLRRIAFESGLAENYHLYGCEIDPERYKNISTNFLDVQVQTAFECVDMFDENYYHQAINNSQLLIIMPGRLFEVSKEKALKFIRALKDKIVVFYAYSDRIEDLHKTAKFLSRHGMEFQTKASNKGIHVEVYIGKVVEKEKELELKLIGTFGGKV
ncbi:MAG: DUF483 domain-containing protein [Patescibacteria group bacterium]|nr:DUF483 domain-containing protein [Patescibacteria group bacterium]